MLRLKKIIVSLEANIVCCCVRNRLTRPIIPAIRCLSFLKRATSCWHHALILPPATRIVTYRPSLLAILLSKFAARVTRLTFKRYQFTSTYVQNTYQYLFIRKKQKYFNWPLFSLCFRFATSY